MNQLIEVLTTQANMAGIAMIGLLTLTYIVLKPAEADAELSYRERVFGEHAKDALPIAIVMKLSDFTDGGPTRMVIVLLLIASLSLFGQAMVDPNILETL